MCQRLVDNLEEAGAQAQAVGPRGEDLPPKQVEQQRGMATMATFVVRSSSPAFAAESEFGSTTQIERTPANSTSWWSLVRAQYRP